MNNFIFIYITNPNKDEAKKIAKYLLNKKYPNSLTAFAEALLCMIIQRPSKN